MPVSSLKSHYRQDKTSILFGNRRGKSLIDELKQYFGKYLRAEIKDWRRLN